METTLTMAGQLAVAGAARLRVAAPGHHAAACAPYGSAVSALAVSAGHQPTTWTKGEFEKPATFMVIDRTNRPTRLLPERSP